MSDELVERLRQISQDMRHDARLDGDARTLREAADEIERLRKELNEMEMSIPLLIDGARKPLMQEVERLRALINEWVDSLNEFNAVWREDDTYVISNRYNDAEAALRNAVGR